MGRTYYSTCVYFLLHLLEALAIENVVVYAVFLSNNMSVLKLERLDRKEMKPG